MVGKGMDKQKDLVPQHVVRKDQSDNVSDQRKRCKKDKKDVLYLFLFEINHKKRAVHRHGTKLPWEEPQIDLAIKDIIKTEPLLECFGKDHEKT